MWVSKQKSKALSAEHFQQFLGKMKSHRHRDSLRNKKERLLFDYIFITKIKFTAKDCKRINFCLTSIYNFADLNTSQKTGSLNNVKESIALLGIPNKQYLMWLTFINNILSKCHNKIDRKQFAFVKCEISFGDIRRQNVQWITRYRVDHIIACKSANNRINDRLPSGKYCLV